MIGCVQPSPHSRLRRQCGVMQDVTARAVNIAENQEIGIFCEKSAEGASLCLTAGVAQRNLRRRNPTQYIGVEDVEQCCATSRHIFMVAFFPQAAPLCGLPAVKHSLPSPMALLCHGIPTSARDLPAVFSRILFSVKYLICWVCNRSTVVDDWVRSAFPT